MTQVWTCCAYIHSQSPQAESKLSSSDACFLHEVNGCNFEQYCANGDDKASL